MTDPRRTPPAAPSRVTFDTIYRDRSFAWLSDPEIAQLTRTPPLTRALQQEWFEGLGARTDYAVWGIECDGEPAGALGLRHIGVSGGAEAFLYLGERRFWGRGAGTWALDELVGEARRRGLRFLTAIVGKDNPRSLALHRNRGFVVAREDDDTYVLGLTL
jgi:RimJ/RimL family protein N-acetyltransferase